MAVAETGQWVGYLSGGCIEHAVAAEAVAAIAAGRSRRVRYGRGSPYLDIILPCGSAIDLVFDVGITLDTLVDIDARLANRLPAAMTIPIPAAGDGQAASFSRLYLPRRRLMILGTGPVAVQLARVGQAGGFDVALHSPDDLTLEAGRASGVASRPLRMPNPSGIAADSRTAIAFVFHDHGREAELLPAALRTEAFYIGALGSRETQRQRLETLKRQGFGESQLERLRGPAGLLPRARSAFDIALSFLAEIVLAERHAELLARSAPAERRPMAPAAAE